jgi:hypothetical protein
MNMNYRAHRKGSVSDKPSLAYPKDHAVRLASGTCCPNCGRTLRAIDAIIGLNDPSDPRIVLRCWSCHADIFEIEPRRTAQHEKAVGAPFAAPGPASSASAFSSTTKTEKSNVTPQ